MGVYHGFYGRREEQVGVKGISHESAQKIAKSRGRVVDPSLPKAFVAYRPRRPRRVRTLPPSVDQPGAETFLVCVSVCIFFIHK